MSKVLLIHGRDPRIGLTEYLRLLPEHHARQLPDSLYHVVLRSPHDEVTLMVFICDAAASQAINFPRASGPRDIAGCCLRVAHVVWPETLRRHMTLIWHEPAMVYVSALMLEGHRITSLLRLLMTITVEWRALNALSNVRTAFHDAHDGLKEKIYRAEDMLAGPSPEDATGLGLPTAGQIAGPIQQFTIQRFSL